jgi:GH15 family glucan-1,4-alpha-glucosidase
MNKRMTARVDGEIVVFLIGMRINRWWKIHRWLRVALAMPRMLRELQAKPELGLLGYEQWPGRTILVLQYWRSMDALLSYAKNRDAEHLPAWRSFNKLVGTNGDVGIWHETYRVRRGDYENIYVNMPVFGLGKAGQLLEAEGKREHAKDRLTATD